MFVAREEELQVLQNLYAKDEFQMAVVYGRRRVGKTALLEHFARDKPTLFFTATEQSSKGNLNDFSKKIAEFFKLPDGISTFQSWADAFSFIASKASGCAEPILFVFDEFPYAAAADGSLPSTLQVAIDHEFKRANMLMVLCGSNEGFMESKILGRKSPLYGRRNAQIRLQPFDCFDAAKMLLDLSTEKKVLYYATFGGTPYYLSQIDKNLSYEENVERLFFSMYGLLYEEPLMFLRQELREPALYNSILGSIASGKNKPKVIADSAGITSSSISKYLKTLETLGLVEKIVPFGENPQRSRKGIYRIKDPFFAYWYRFVAPNVGAVEAGAGAQVARANAFGEVFSTYIGIQFEKICEQWLVRQNKLGELGFLASAFGKWWGADPYFREEVDIDLIAGDKQKAHALFCECKWRNSFDESKSIKLLKERSKLLQGYDDCSFALFSKNPVSDATLKRHISKNDVMFYSVEDLFLTV